MSYLRYLCLFAYIGVLNILTIRVTWRMSCEVQELLVFCGRLGSPPDFRGVCVAHRFSFLCLCFCFVCLRSVLCVPNVASFLGLPILDPLSGFTNVYFNTHLVVKGCRLGVNLLSSSEYVWVVHLVVSIVNKFFAKHPNGFITLI
jgi:hypothetical protein